MNTGKLNKRITIVTPGTLTATTTGGFTEGAVTSVTTWCEAEQLSMTEQLRNGLETASASYRFTFRFQSADMTRVKELTYQTRNFRVVNIENVDEESRTMTVIANEQR